MKLIAHRGNLNGPNLLEENKPSYIEKAIKLGFFVEIDIWYIEDELYLGHDIPSYKISFTFLENNKNYIFGHCKNIEALHYILNKNKDIEIFYHNMDDCVLTSKNNIWTFPGKILTNKSICVMPEKIRKCTNEIGNYNEDNLLKCYGICSDYVSILKKNLNIVSIIN